MSDETAAPSPIPPVPDRVAYLNVQIDPATLRVICADIHSEPAYSAEGGMWAEVCHVKADSFPEGRGLLIDIVRSNPLLAWLRPLLGIE